MSLLHPALVVSPALPRPILRASLLLAVDLKEQTDYRLRVIVHPFVCFYRYVFFAEVTFLYSFFFIKKKR